MSAPTLLVRADASVAMGTGHVMRSLALAQAWQDSGGRVVFAMAETTPALAERLRGENFDIADIPSGLINSEDSQATAKTASEQGAEWVVIDGYQFGSEYQAALKSAGFRILFVDDYGHGSPYSADLILNQNVSAKPEFYVDRRPDTRLLLGTSYCLLRREFADFQGWSREISPTCRRLLVLMGGSDPQNLTGRVIEAIRPSRVHELEATIVVGGSNPHFEDIRKTAADSGLIMRVQRDVSNLAELMTQSDVAISAAGSTSWELCMLGLPSLLLDVAHNQTELARELDRRGCAIHAGNQDTSSAKIAEALAKLCASPEIRQSLSQRSRALVDGQGASRVVSVLRGTPELELRRVRADDRCLLWEWANDRQVREASFSPEPISWETHVAWFEGKLQSAESASNRSMLLIAEEDSVPVGQIRFDARPDDGWEVDVSVARAMRGRGIGSKLIRLGIQELSKSLIQSHIPSTRVHALVKSDNMASVNAFEQAGFQRIGGERVRDFEAIDLVFEITHEM